MSLPGCNDEYDYQILEILHLINTQSYTLSIKVNAAAYEEGVLELMNNCQHGIYTLAWMLNVQRKIQVISVTKRNTQCTTRPFGFCQHGALAFAQTVCPLVITVRVAGQRSDLATLLLVFLFSRIRSVWKVCQHQIASENLVLSTQSQVQWKTRATIHRLQAQWLQSYLFLNVEQLAMAERTRALGIVHAIVDRWLLYELRSPRQVSTNNTPARYQCSTSASRKMIQLVVASKRAK